MVLYIFFGRRAGQHKEGGTKQRVYNTNWVMFLLLKRNIYLKVSSAFSSLTYNPYQQYQWVKK